MHRNKIKIISSPFKILKIRGRNVITYYAMYRPKLTQALYPDKIPAEDLTELQQKDLFTIKFFSFHSDCILHVFSASENLIYPNERAAEKNILIRGTI